ncbi:MAG: MerR family transcriptional regulator [Limnohabitans sp.]|nr:MerR family transcriptional regulator [Limnohabitans sp.]
MQFSIKDLENLSGIKAHTIRIWEKRYGVLTPMRTDSNIRYYDLSNLQKLLNITLLHNHGYKISKISKSDAKEIAKLVSEIVNEKSVKNHAISAFKLAMMNFDQTLFTTTYTKLLSEKSFREIFYQIFIPLMNEIGLLWQSETITPAHEHFITNLIRQKIIINTELLQNFEPSNESKVFVLFLPLNEIHELALLYLNYEIISNGYKTLYLGESIPMENLKDVLKYFDNIIFISCITVEPSYDKINDYLDTITNEIIEKSNSELWIGGRMTQHISKTKINSKIRIFDSIEEITSEIQ